MAYMAQQVSDSISLPCVTIFLLVGVTNLPRVKRSTCYCTEWLLVGTGLFSILSVLSVTLRRSAFIIILLMSHYLFIYLFNTPDGSKQ